MQLARAWAAAEVPDDFGKAPAGFQFPMWALKTALSKDFGSINRFSSTMWAKLTPCLQADGQWIVIHQIFTPQKSDNHLKGLLPFCKQAGKLSSPANFFYREAILVSESVLGHQAYSALCWHIRASKIHWCNKRNHLVEPISWEKGVC